MLGNVGPAQHHAGLVHQIGQDALFLGGKAEAFAFHGKTALMRVVRQRPHLQHGLGMAIGTTHQRTQPQHHFLVHEGLGEIVVGAGTKARQLVAPATAPGEDQHRETAPLLAPVLQHRHAVQLGQAEIEHGCIIFFGAAEKIGLATIGGNFRHHAGLVQHTGQAFGQLTVIFNDQYPHQRTSISSSSSTRPVTGSRVTSISVSLSRRRSTS